jgi:serine/threonine protein kinase
VAGLAFGATAAIDTSGMADEVLPPPNLDDYDVLGEIGRGGMGVVFKARHRKLGRIVALKMIRAGHWASAVELQRFRTEAQAAALLQHPNIVTVYEFGEHNRLPYLSMQFVEGKTLAEMVEAGPLPPKRAAGYLRTMAQAIHYAHEAGILHRDLKPSNILIDGSGQLHITDFGLAKLLAPDNQAPTRTELTLTGQVLGTPGFMPPEQAAANSQAIGPASDVYSLGAILYFLLSARPPFTGGSPAQTLSKVLNEPPIPPRRLNKTIPRDLETICLKCLEKVPERRYASTRELADELERFIDGQPIQAQPVGELVRFWRWCRRFPTSASLGASLIATLLVLAVTIAISVRRNQTDNVQPANVHAANDAVASRTSRNYSGPIPGVIVFDADTLAQTDVGTGMGVAVDRKNGNYWAATLYEGGVVVREGKTNRELKRFALGDCPGSVVIDPVRRLAWVAAQCGVSSNTNYPSNDLLWAIDTDTYQIINGPIPCGGVNGSPETVNPLTGRYYHNVNGTQRVDCRSFVPTRPSFGPVIGVHPTANLLYASGPSNDLQIIDGKPDPEVVLTNVPLPCPPTCVAVNLKQDFLYVGSNHTNEILVLNPRSGQRLNTIRLDAGVNADIVWGLAMDDQNRRLFAVAARQSRCWLFAIQGAAQRAVELPALAGGPVLDPAVNKVYVWGQFQTAGAAQSRPSQ